MDGADKYCYWIDLRRYEDTNKFVWANNNELSNTEQDFWMEGEPNNKNSNENCVKLCAPKYEYPNDVVKPEVAPVAKLNDNPCTLDFRYICTIDYQTCP